ncbi:hypothetical protein NW754_009564 [Fusarium falciforme]|nr:hypothetical protein NW754_009564 [Fusarium falciforme]
MGSCRAQPPTHRHRRAVPSNIQREQGSRGDTPLAIRYAESAGVRKSIQEAVRRLLESIKAPDPKDRSAMVKTGEWVVKRKKSERASIGRSRALRECEDLSMKEHYPDHLSHQDVLDELQEWDEAAGEEEVEQDTFQLFVPDPSQVFQLL